MLPHLPRSACQHGCHAGANLTKPVNAYYFSASPYASDPILWLNFMPYHVLTNILKLF